MLRMKYSRHEWLTEVNKPEIRMSMHNIKRDFLSSSPRPDHLWGPPSLLANGY